MLHDLDSTLRELLSRELSPDLVSQVNFSFDTPNPDAIQAPAINLFLYDVRENLELRTGEWIVERQENGTARKRRPSARVDCSYLITAWPAESKTGGDNIRSTAAWEEHRLLGAVMTALMRHRLLPEAVLQGNLQGQEPPLRTLALRPSHLQSLGEFWQAVGGKPKATLNYTVTISVPVHVAEEIVPLVVDRQIYLQPSVDRSNSASQSSS